MDEATPLQMEDQKIEYTLDEAISSIGFGKFQYIVIAYAGLGWVSEAMEMMLSSFIGAAIQPEWEISQSQQSLISTMVSIGMLVGAYSWGLISDSYGRKRGILGAAITTIITGFLSAFATNYTVLLILRCCVGVGLGCSHVFLSWYIEFVPTPNRGIWMVIFTGFWTLGSITEAGLAWSIMPTYSWRWLLGLSTVPSVLVLLLYLLVPESPRYLYAQGRSPEAHEILTKVAKLNKTELPEGKLVTNQIEVIPIEGELSISNRLLSKLKNNPITISISELLSLRFKKTTLLLWLVYFANTFSYYGIVLLTSQLSIRQSEYGPTIMQPPNDSLYKNVFITSFAEFLGLCIAAAMVIMMIDRVGRKISMVIMIVIGFSFLLPLVLHQNQTTTTACLFGARTFISASFTIAHIYAPEIYPTNLRATGVGIAMGMGRIGGILCSLIPLVIGTAWQQTLQVILFEVTIFLLGVTVMFLPFEPSGRALEDNASLVSSEPSGRAVEDNASLLSSEPSGRILEDNTDSSLQQPLLE